METQLNISGYSNEDIDRVYRLRSGTADSSTPLDLSSTSFLMDVKDQKGALVLHLSSNSGGGITITDAPNGEFAIHIAVGSIQPLPNRSLQYDLLMIAGGETKRLWGGSIRIAPGLTAVA
jgi:hypothetical protein